MQFKLFKHSTMNLKNCVWIHKNILLNYEAFYIYTFQHFEPFNNSLYLERVFMSEKVKRP